MEIIQSDFCLIPVSFGSRGVQYAIVDLEDQEWVTQYSWQANSVGYAQRTTQIGGRKGKKVTILMHREIYQKRTGSDLANLTVDHINRNKLDNRVWNLRTAKQSQNMANVGLTTRNKSGYKGVCWNVKGSAWVASIKKNGKCIYLGYYDTPEEAAVAYNKAAIELNGEFAYLNDVDMTIEPKRRR